MVRKHIRRDYSAHKKSVVRPMDEYIKLEIFSYNHINTEIFSSYKNNLSLINAVPITTYAWVGYESQNQSTRFDINFHYTVTSPREYRLDVAYLSKDDRDMTGFININRDGEQISTEKVVFDGEVDILKRQTQFYTLEEGTYEFNIRMPVNTIFLGGIVREIITYSGDNIDSAGTNLMFTSATISHTSETKPAEVTCSVGYDDDFECNDSSSGFYIDFHDEMNIYTKDEDGQLKQIFGGYVSSILPDNDRTKLTITGADRLIDGQNKYVLNEMFLLGGTTTHEDYLTEDYKDFPRYGSALKYLCDLFEVTLQNNINENYLVGGESYSDAVTCTFGEEGNVKDVKPNEVELESNKNYITVRNNATSDTIQSVILYDYNDFVTNPVDITDYPNFFITYGLGDPKTETEVATATSSGDASNSISGGFDKLGVSADGTQLMAIGKPSASGESKYGYKFYKSIYKRKCPFCGSTELIWGWKWSSSSYGYFPEKGTYEGGSLEGHIFCKSCDADFSCIEGKDHMSPPRAVLTRISGPDASSEAEAQKLKNGEMTTSTSTTTTTTDTSTSTSTISESELFQAITNEAFNYTYKLRGGTCSSWSCMQKAGYGDCWAFSELIYVRLKERGVAARVMDYVTSGSDNHRSTQYKDASGNWQNFPYRSYGWNTKYNNMLNDTTAVWGGRVVYECDGNGIDAATGGVSAIDGSGSGTTTTKIINGYDKDKIFYGYFQIDYRVINNQGNVFDSYLVLDFSQQSNNASSYGNNDKGFDPIKLNNSIKQANIDCNQYIKEDSYSKGFTDAYADGLQIYLRSIKLKSLSTGADGTNAPYYETQENTIDNASCKLDIYACGFNNGTLINPTDLSSCGKSINTEIEALIKASGYVINMEYAKHRKDDIINFAVNNQNTAKFIAQEGDDNNILSWSSISYTPVTSLYNNSIYVFKKQGTDKATYKYVNSKNSGSVMQYGEQSSLQTTSEILSDKEAYYYSRVKNDKYNWKPTYTYTISVIGTPDLDINDLVQVKADAQKLNTVKEVQSIKITYDYSKIPRIQTQLGLGEMAQEFQLKKLLREIRESAKKESTLFSGTASKITDTEVYQWER